MPAMEDLIRHLQELKTTTALVGESAAFRQAVRNLPAVAKGDATVLVTGETGTGKELIARAIHYLSTRRPHPFVAVNCGSIPDTLLEAELFGHERGAFTDAHAERAGLIAQANRGTLFLDEVDALTMRAQVALLRVLQEKSYRPIGSARERQADVRVVAATNTALEELVHAGAFRSDLYYRLRIFTLHLPALRERAEDIPVLAEHFLRKHTTGSAPPFFTEAAMDSLRAHSWPGNIRELESAIIRGIAYCVDGLIDTGDLDLTDGCPAENPRRPAQAERAGSLRTRKREVIEAFERDYLRRLMQEHGGNVTRAARSAGKERRELGKLLRKYDLDPHRSADIA